MGSEAKGDRDLSIEHRKQTLESFETEEFDLLVVGGGITGAGVARDAASRGMKVALVNSRDYAEGTSSRSSKLIHGGVRYLENYEFHLVFEALSERRHLFEIAPHLVHPLRFNIPLYKGGRVPPWMMQLGMFLYDALALFETPEPHASHDVQQTLDITPTLEKHNLLGSVAYSDAYMDDDRLVHETLRSAVKLGASCANHVRVLKVNWEQDNQRQSKADTLKAIGAEVEDEITHKKYNIKAKHVVVAVGPWTDIIGPHLFPASHAPWKRKLRPSKGVHLVFHRNRVPIDQAVVMAAEKRIVFVIPRKEMVIVGTTDTDFTGDIAKPRAEQEDIRYLLDITKKYFPHLNLTAKDIVSTYAGVRPLIDDDSETESKTSREHEIWSYPEGVTIVAGGKYTTYRKMAEDVVEAALSHLSIEERAKWNRASTMQALNPFIEKANYERGFAMLSAWANELDVPTNFLSKLFERHGEESKEIIRKYSRREDRLLTEDQRLWVIEARHAIHSTQCMRLKDFYFRRVPIFLTKGEQSLKLLSLLSEQFQLELGWDSATRQHSEAEVKEQIDYELAWRKYF